MDYDPRKALTGILVAFESLAYLLIAFGLCVPTVMLVVSAATNMLEVLEVGVLGTGLAVIDRLLLALILVELIATIRVLLTTSERGIFIAEPFLLVGLVAAVRSILLITASLKGGASIEEVQTLIIELGGMTVLVIVLMVALYFIRRMRLSEKKLEISE